MRVFCRFAALSLLVVSAALARATPADFKMHVLDPPPGVTPSLVFSSPFTVSFSACFQGELPGGNTADGCFLGVNKTGTDWLGLEFAFANTAALGSQPTDCSLAPNSNVYTATSCALDPNLNTYFLDFNNGVIRNGESFYVTEEGVDPALFPAGTATVTSATPEPGSLLLLGTGITMLAMLLWVGRARLRGHGSRL